MCAAMHVVFPFMILVPYVHLNVVYEYGPCVEAMCGWNMALKGLAIS